MTHQSSTPQRDLTGAHWFKSSYSNGGNGCVEVAGNIRDIVAIRDTKNRAGGTHLVSRSTWTAFIDAVADDRM